jgi:ArsR family transcriptional regulator
MRIAVENLHRAILTNQSFLMQQPTPVADALDAEQASMLLKALADPHRQRIVLCLGMGERCVCDLTDELKLAQSKLSFHLRVLKEAGLLMDRQRGRWIYYRLQPEMIQALQLWLGRLQDHCTASATPCPD